MASKWVGLDPRYSFFTPLDLIPFLGPALKIRKAGKIAAAAYSLARTGNRGRKGLLLPGRAWSTSTALKFALKDKHVQRHGAIGAVGLLSDWIVYSELFDEFSSHRGRGAPSGDSPSRTDLLPSLLR